MTHWALILFAATMNVVLNLSLRQVARSFGGGGLGRTLLSLLGAPSFWLAGASGVLLVLTFAVAIRHFSLSLTYTAITALAMVALTLIGVAMNEDALSAGRVLGLALIVAGLAVTAWATI